jgi:hypothetical protein
VKAAGVVAPLKYYSRRMYGKTIDEEATFV